MSKAKSTCLVSDGRLMYRTTGAFTLVRPSFSVGRPFSQTYRLLLNFRAIRIPPLYTLDALHSLLSCTMGDVAYCQTTCLRHAIGCTRGLSYIVGKFLGSRID